MVDNSPPVVLALDIEIDAGRLDFTQPVDELIKRYWPVH
mgnify:CR=1 FL=1